MSTVSPAAPPVAAQGGSLRLSRLSDELLARQVTRGSERAFAALYERYHQPLYRYSRSIVRNDADAQDVLQSTFTRALSALQRDRRSAPLRPWLYRIAHNEAISLLRRRSREHDEEPPDAGTRASASAEDEAVDRARWSTLLADLAVLPDRQRSALLLRELSGLSHEEIAIALGTGIGSAKQAIFEARQALAELAEGRAMSCDEIRRRISEGDRRVLRGRRVRAHLHDCRGCASFAAAIPSRRAELRALTPALPLCCRRCGAFALAAGRLGPRWVRGRGVDRRDRRRGREGRGHGHGLEGGDGRGGAGDRRSRRHRTRARASPSITWRCVPPRSCAIGVGRVAGASAAPAHGSPTSARAGKHAAAAPRTGAATGVRGHAPRVERGGGEHGGGDAGGGRLHLAWRWTGRRRGVARVEHVRDGQAGTWVQQLVGEPLVGGAQPGAQPRFRLHDPLARGELATVGSQPVRAGKLDDAHPARLRQAAAPPGVAPNSRRRDA